ncbi:MAG: hypothetical protein LC729_01420, partial [Acidobacteria bacterium]|nr:hypothetical protein [Acidobacteriota bacterium]
GEALRICHRRTGVLTCPDRAAAGHNKIAKVQATAPEVQNRLKLDAPPFCTTSIVLHQLVL